MRIHHGPPVSQKAHPFLFLRQISRSHFYLLCKLFPQGDKKQLTNALFTWEISHTIKGNRVRSNVIKDVKHRPHCSQKESVLTLIYYGFMVRKYQCHSKYFI